MLCVCVCYERAIKSALNKIGAREHKAGISINMNGDDRNYVCTFALPSEYVFSDNSGRTEAGENNSAV